MKFAIILKELRKKSGYTQEQLSKMLNISKSTVSMYENGERTPPPDMLEKIADIFKIDINVLFGRGLNEAIAKIGNSDKLYFLDKENVYMIPLFESVSAGFGAQPHSVPVDFVPCYITSASEAEQTLCIKVTGDSMFPKIENGDTIQVLKQNYIDSGSVAVVMIDGEEAVVKKVIYDNKTIELHSFNPMYPVQTFEGKDKERIMFLGVVKKIIKSI